MSVQVRRMRSRCDRQRQWALVLSILSVSFVGCGSQEPKEGLVRAYGYVTLDGQPLEKALVTFDHPDEAGTYGRTDSGGYFDMSFTRSQVGAFTGINAVSFSTADVELGILEMVPEQYLERRSKLTVEVTDSGSPYNFDLTSDPSVE